MLKNMWGKVKQLRIVQFVKQCIIPDDVGNKLKGRARWKFAWNMGVGVVTGVAVGVAVGGFAGILLFAVIVVRSIISDINDYMLLYGCGEIVNNLKQQTEVMNEINAKLAMLTDAEMVQEEFEEASVEPDKDSDVIVDDNTDVIAEDTKTDI